MNQKYLKKMSSGAFTLRWDWGIDVAATAAYSFLLSPVNGAWSKLFSESLRIHSMHGKGCFKQKKRLCGVFGVCVQSKNYEFQKRGRRSGGSHRAKPGKWGERGQRAASWGSSGFGQGAAIAAESRIHDRFFGSWSNWYGSSKTARMTLTPNTLWSHGKTALIHPRDLIIVITARSKDPGARSKQKEWLKDSTSQHAL